MTINQICTLLKIVLLIICVGFFTSSETAFLSLPKLKLRTMVDKGRRNAKKVQKLKNNMDRLLTTVLIGTNFLNSLASSLATAFAIELLGESAIAYVPFIVAFFITTFGQIVPKTAAGLYPENFTCMFAIPLLVLQKIFFPVVWIFERISHVVVVIITKVVKTQNAIITEEELTTLIDLGKNEGTIEENESKMLNKIIKFNDLCVNDILKHRSFISMIDTDATLDDVISEFIRTGFSIITVYSENKENVVGILKYQDVLLNNDSRIIGKGFAGKKMKTDVLFIPGTLTVFELLTKFRRDENKFAVVLNEQGETDGIITIDDILRVVFGRMTDENVSNDIAPEDKVQLISANTFLVPGEMKIEDVNEILGLNLSSDDFTTIGGWLLEQFGVLPSNGQVLINEKNIFTAEDVSQRRIVSVRIKIKN